MDAEQGRLLLQHAIDFETHKLGQKLRGPIDLPSAYRYSLRVLPSIARSRSASELTRNGWDSRPDRYSKIPYPRDFLGC